MKILKGNVISGDPPFFSTASQIHNVPINDRSICIHLQHLIFKKLVIFHWNKIFYLINDDIFLINDKILVEISKSYDWPDALRWKCIHVFNKDNNTLFYYSRLDQINEIESHIRYIGRCLISKQWRRLLDLNGNI